MTHAQGHLPDVGGRLEDLPTEIVVGDVSRKMIGDKRDSAQFIAEIVAEPPDWIHLLSRDPRGAAMASLRSRAFSRHRNKLDLGSATARAAP
jgi:hypothetical protein